MREIKGILGTVISIWAAGGAALHLYFAGFGFPEPMKLASLHLAIFVPLVFLLFGARAGSPRHRPSAVDFLLSAAAILPSVYVYLNGTQIYERSAFMEPLSTLQLVLGTAMVLLIVEAVRRALSLMLAILVAAALLYMFAAPYLPGVWYYRQMPYSEIVEAMYFTTGSGLYGSLTMISATIVTTFLAFGAFMYASGMGRLFTNVGGFLAGRFVGGPAKVAVVSSALFGTMSGSSVANVVVTGSMSIPMMKRLGFSAPMAAGIEAASSVGGAIMPPVMGAAAFVMAETIAEPYTHIIAAAALGAALYYFSILATVHFEAKRLGIAPMPKSEIPRLPDLGRDIHLVLPMVLLVTLMMMRFSPYLAAFWSTLATVVASWIRQHTRMGPKEVFEALAAGGKTVAVLVAAVTSAGIITAALTHTGLLLAFTGIIKTVAGDSLMMLTLLLAFACLFMGMGVPTTPAYIITAAIGAPLLAAYGVPLINAHLFVFYFAVLADATPPVAAASYAAAAIAGSPPLAAGARAFRLALGGFMCGITFVYEPALTLNGSLLDIVAVTVSIASGLALVAAGLSGYVEARLPFWARVPVVLLGLFCGLGHFVPVWQRALVGVALLVGLFMASRRQVGLVPPPDAALVPSKQGKK